MMLRYFTLPLLARTKDRRPIDLWLMPLSMRSKCILSPVSPSIQMGNPSDKIPGCEQTDYTGGEDKVYEECLWRWVLREGVVYGLLF
jgi:hypothetical protein